MLKHIAQTDIDRARHELSRLDASLARAHEAIPVFDWRTRVGGFAGLAQLIVEQQVSVASAKAIWQRLEHGLGMVAASRVVAKTMDELKSYGLSTPKARYIYGLAEACISGALNLDELVTLDDEAARAQLIQLKGVGAWTAEVYLMCCDARIDVFPAADIALQEAIRVLDGAVNRPSTKELYLRAQRWSPYRSVAAHLLWGYYGAVKKNSIVIP